MQFSSFLVAIQNRLAGLIATGLFKRIELHQALELAAYRADLENRIKAFRDSGATRSAAYLEEALERMDASSGAAGVGFANELLADSYGPVTTHDDIPSTDVADGEQFDGPTKKRGRKSLSA